MKTLGRGMETGEERETGIKVLVKNQIFILSYRPVTGVRDLGVWSTQDQTGCRSSILIACSQQGFQESLLEAGRAASLCVQIAHQVGISESATLQGPSLVCVVTGLTQRALWFLCILPAGVSVRKVITFEGFCFCFNHSCIITSLWVDGYY